MARKKSKWRCPECGVGAHEHPKGMRRPKSCVGEHDRECEGLLCECDECGRGHAPGSDPDAKDHGLTPENPCVNANCYHCGWGGALPSGTDSKERAESPESPEPSEKAAPPISMVATGTDATDEQRELIEAMRKVVYG